MNTVAVIIPTYKRPGSLLKCLNSISKQSHRPDEALIIDGDGGGFLGSFLRENFKENLRYEIIGSLPGLTRQRNVGINKAKSDIVLFLDDDVIVDEDYVKEIIKVFEYYPGNIGGVSGKVEGSRGFGNRLVKMFYAIYARIFFLYHEGDGKFLPSGFATHCSYERYKDITPVEFLFGCNMAFKRETILQFGFDENLYRYMYLEDDDIAYRISRKYQNYWTPFALVTHIGPQERRNDFIRVNALIKNFFYLHKKNFPSFLRYEIIFYWSLVGWLFFEMMSGLILRDLSRFSGMVIGLKETIYEK